MSDVSLVFNLLAIDRISSVIGDIKNNFGKFAIESAVGVAELGGKLVEMGGDFEFAMDRLVTGAGESQSNLKLVSDGILAMAGRVGESTKDLSAGMYLVESAGFHGADGLKVLEAAAEGAKTGNADMATVADAVTTALGAYHLGADQAAAATNALVAAEGQGKTNLEALAGSLSTVAPIAATAHISLNEVLGAMATMTAQGTPAADAATYLKQTIGQLSNPSGQAAQEMQSLGLSAVQVGQNLGKNGLASTLTMLTDAIEKKMGPAGTVLVDHLRKAAANSDDFQKVLANLPPAQQTYIGALATMVGGTKSMQAALELTGDHMTDFEHNTDVINEKVKSGGSNIEGWSLIQTSFNQKLAEAKATVEALGVKIGVALLPAAKGIIDAFMGAVAWGSRHKDVLKDIGIAVGVIAAAFALYKLTVFAIEAPMKAWIALQWLLDAAMDANPIGLIVVAIAAVVAVVILLWTHSAGFRNFFIGLWADIWGFLKAVGSWFAGPFAHFFVGLWNGAVGVWNAVWGFLKAIGSWFAGPFVNFFVSAGHAIAAPFLWLWHNVIEPLYSFWSAVFSVIMRIVVSFRNLLIDLGEIIMQRVYNGLIKPAIEGIGVIFNWLLANVVRPLVLGFKLEMHALAAAAMWVYDNGILPAWNAIKAAADWLYNTVIAPLVNLVTTAFQAIANVAMWLWHNGIEPAIHGAGEVFSWLWNTGSHFFGLIMGKVDELGNKFRDIFNAIGGFISNAFSSATGIVRGAINSVIGVVNSAINFINSDVIDSANKLPGVNFPHIPHIPMLASGGDIVSGGLAVVGEQGAEVVALPTGARVFPHGTGPGGASETVYLKPGNELGDLLIKVLRNAISARGGNPVIVLKG